MKKALYLYSDILGYKSLIEKYSIVELRTVLKDALADVKTVLDDEMVAPKTPPKNFGNLSNPELEEKLERYNREYFYDFQKGELDFYFAFDTLIIYWKDLDISDTIYSKQQDLFFNLVSIVFLNLYIKYDILLRGTISITSDYYIDDNIVLIKEIEQVYLIEKFQNWGGIFIYGKELIDVFDICDLTDDTFTLCEYAEIPFKINNNKLLLDSIIEHELNIKLEHFLKWSSRYGYSKPHCLVLNPINNFTVSYLKERKLFDKLKEIISKDYELSDLKDDGALLKHRNTKKYINEKIANYDRSKTSFIANVLRNRW